jgi:hypothetical protein
MRISTKEPPTGALLIRIIAENIDINYSLNIIINVH